MKPATWYKERIAAQMTAYLTQRDIELHLLVEEELSKIEEALDAALRSFHPAAPKQIFIYRQYNRRDMYVKVFDELKKAGYDIFECSNSPSGYIKIQIIVPA